MDFNIDPMSTVIMQPQPNGEVWVVDEIVQFGSNTEEICEEIERKYWRYMKQIVIFPDPAGGQRQHAHGESDLDIMREKGFKK
ncbi:terminase, partial [Acinetobacter baumannii]